MGGAQYQAKFLTHELAAQGCEVYYLARTTPDDPSQDETHQVVSFKATERSRIFDALSLYQALKRIKPDIIYQRVACAYTGVCAFYAKHHRCKMCWHMASEPDARPHRPTGLKPTHWVEAMMTQYGVRNASTIVAQTQDQADLLSEHHHRDVAAVIPNFQPAPEDPGSKDGPRTVVWIGNLKPLKQPDVFVQLAAEMSDVDCRFKMIGRPWEDAAKQQDFEARVNGIDQLDYLGGLSQEAVNEILRDAHLLVNTSTHEGFSNTFIQAWMRRVPVVSLNTHPDGVFDGERLGVCANGSIEAMRKAVKRYLTDSNFQVAAGERARQESVATFSMENVRRLSELLQAS